ncbi:hypothetical protein Tco_0129275 [Tanacetum coccineum]
MGMDRLSKRKFVIVCHEKVVRIPLEGDEMLRCSCEELRSTYETIRDMIILRIGRLLTYVSSQIFSKIVKPLTSLTERNQKYEWGAEQEEAFQTLKNDLCFLWIIQYGVRGMILAAQSEAFKQENNVTEGFEMRLDLILNLTYSAVACSMGRDWESSLTGLELVPETTDKFEVEDYALLKVTPWKGVVRFGKKDIAAGMVTMRSIHGGPQATKGGGFYERDLGFGLVGMLGTIDSSFYLVHAMFSLLSSEYHDDKKIGTCPILLTLKKLMEGILGFVAWRYPRMGKSQAELTDESHVLLKVPRKNNMYSVDLKNIVPKGDEGFFIGKVRPNWLFDIDALTKSMNYKLVIAGNQFTGNTGTKACDDAGKARMETVPSKDYILLPLWPADLPFSQNLKSSLIVVKEDNVNNTNNVNVASINKVNVVGAKASIELPDDPNMPELEDIIYLDDDEDVGAEADMNNLNTFMPVSPIPTIRMHKDHPVEQIIRDLNSTPKTRRMTKNLEEHEEPKKVIHALKDPSWIEAMQDELLQF